jgi:sugar lactone lactonase YvrE
MPWSGQPLLSHSNRSALFASILAVAATSVAAQAPASFVAFESGPVRPLAMSPSGSRLFAVNTPDNRLEVFQVGGSGLIHLTSVPVGLEPVAVAARNEDEVWVVNHLSDSVSIVSLATDPPRVVRTLMVGDEPRDIVFAGPGRRRAFITTARRGQMSALQMQPFTEGLGRAAVWVFDADALGAGHGGTPISFLRLFGDTPRALAATPDGSKVWAGIFHSGNRTTTVHRLAVPDEDRPPPLTNADGEPAPEAGLIVKFDGTHWVGPGGGTFDDQVEFSLPDYDVFEIDAMANPPATVRNHRGVGTVLFNMVWNPSTQALYVSNTDSRNQVRFEGPGEFGASTVRGHVVENRITVVRDNSVVPRHLNPHIDYSTSPGPPGEIERSLAIPLDMVLSLDGATLYVAAFGSSKIGVFSTAELEAGTFVPSTGSQIEVSGGGPAGLALDEFHDRLYVLTRFDNSVASIDLASGIEMQALPLNNPEPPSLVAGRRFLYDARHTSGHGDNACASCHVFGDLDSLAWDLGNPDDPVEENGNPFRNVRPVNPAFHPMKGPMTTQSLRGLSGVGPLHWRGDRTGASTGQDPLDEALAFQRFNVAFDSLLGRGGPLTAAEMQAFTSFILQVTYPPNPIRNLDNTLTPAQERGRVFFTSQGASRGVSSCQNCHRLDPQAGQFGTDGFSSSEVVEPQAFKIPQLRNLYQKVGMFGMPLVSTISGGEHDLTGEQIRGFGFMHDGSVDTLQRFLRSIIFTFPGGDLQRLDVGSFLLAFDSDLAPIVGQQVTLTSSNAGTAGARIDLLVARASVVQPRRECDLIAKGTLNGASRGWLMVSPGLFQTDRASQTPLGDAALRQIASVPGQELTYTCVPPGSGPRMALDRDEDGFFDRDEIDGGSDPTDAQSVPADRDGDGVTNLVDNCPDVANPQQLDSDFDGIGNPCDLDSVLVVSSNPADQPNFFTIQGAVDAAIQSGTTIRILPGLGPYHESVQVNREMQLRLVGVAGPGSPVVIDGGAGAAIDVLSGSAGIPVAIEGFDVRGAAGIRAWASTLIDRVNFQNISGTALGLYQGTHDVRRVTVATAGDGVHLAAGAVMTLDTARFDGVAGTAVDVAGTATIRTIAIDTVGDGVSVAAGGSLDLAHSTIANGSGVGVSAAAGSDVTVRHTILWGNGSGDLIGVACADVSWSDVGSANCSAVGNNISVNPILLADLQLGSGSPAADHGPDPATFTGTPSRDLAGGPRLRDANGDGLVRLDVGAYERVNPTWTATEIQNVRWVTKQRFVWDAHPSAASYAVYSGVLGTLSYSNFGTCRATVTSPALDEIVVPAPGSGRFYLVALINSAAQEGTLGPGSSAERSRFGPRCVP